MFSIPRLVGVLGCLGVSLAFAFFVPKSLEDKVREADLIGRGRVLSITRILTEEMNGGSQAGDAYQGPLSIAAVRVLEVWKRPQPTSTSSGGSTEALQVIPRTIMVPCDYTFDESPSSLTLGREYVLFLKDLGANLFHPVDAASTHRIKDERVSSFGMDAEPAPTSGDDTLSVKEFKTAVLAELARERK